MKVYGSPNKGIALVYKVRAFEEEKATDIVLKRIMNDVEVKDGSKMTRNVSSKVIKMSFDFYNNSYVRYYSSI